MGALAFAAFLSIFLHALSWLRKGQRQGAKRVYLSRSHARRRLVSSGLIMFEIVWLAVGATVLRGRIFSSRTIGPAFVFLTVLVAAILVTLVLAYMDFREATGSYRRMKRNNGDEPH